jgi:predicted TIM-barrel fold metal-dependent hydrolase
MLVNSADSHVLEPSDLWRERMPSHLHDRMLRIEDDRGRELIYLDNKLVRRTPPGMDDLIRPPGAHDPAARMLDLEGQGVWSELMFPSQGLWVYLADDPELAFAHARVYNDWLNESFMKFSPRFIGAAIIPTVDIDLAVAELRRVHELGYQGVNLTCDPPPDMRYNDPRYEPLWQAVEELQMRVCFHVGTGSDPVVERGPGGAVINYVETYVPAQRTLMYLVAGGVLDRHRDLHVIFVECGVSWLAGLMERMDEGYRQFAKWVRPPLSGLPSEIVRRQVSVTFQLDKTFLATLPVTGSEPILWGSDYPHVEGTYPHTQEALAEIFDGADEETRLAVSVRNFERLFSVPAPEGNSRS